ncbi:hypothetical protein ACQEU3_33450 [Spirillospora sp. CA-253888]
MSVAESETSETTPAPPWWRRRRPLALAAGGGALLLAAAAAVVLTAGGDGEERAPVELVAPVGRPDPVPTGRVVEKLPADCGVPVAAVRALVPGAEVGHGSCDWYVDRHKGPVLATDLSRNDKVSGAMSEYDRPTLRDPDWVEPIRLTGAATVTGLGDEATLYQKPGHVYLLFRVGNVVGRVVYKASGRTAVQMRDAGFRAASEMARKLGAPARPVLGAPTGVSGSVKHLPQVCDALPDAVAERLVPGGEGRQVEREGPLWRISGASVSTCTWSGTPRDMLVSLAAFPDRLRGPGAWQAERAYREAHVTARTENNGFTALAGLGEQAFGAEDHDNSQMVVVFRVGNVVAAVEYGELQRPTLQPDAEALKGAYTAGLKVAEKLAVASGG